MLLYFQQFNQDPLIDELKKLKGRGEDPLFPLNLVSPEVNGFFSKHNVIKFRKGLPPASPVIGLTKGPKRSKFLWQYPAVS